MNGFPAPGTEAGCFFLACLAAGSDHLFDLVLLRQGYTGCLALRSCTRPGGFGDRSSGVRPPGSDRRFHARFGSLGRHLLLVGVQLPQDGGPGLEQAGALLRIFLFGDLAQGVVKIQLLERVEHPILLGKQGGALVFFFLVLFCRRSAGGWLPEEKRAADEHPHQHEHCQD